jgi:hypothetical protein
LSNTNHINFFYRHWNTFSKCFTFRYQCTLFRQWFHYYTTSWALWPTNTKDLVECCSSDTSAIYTALRKAAMGNTMFINMTYLQYQRTFPSFADCRLQFYSLFILLGRDCTRTIFYSTPKVVTQINLHY